MSSQKWECEKCQKSGEVNFEKGADVMSVVCLIKEDHERVSPSCNQPTGFIRCPSGER